MASKRPVARKKAAAPSRTSIKARAADDTVAIAANEGTGQAGRARTIIYVHGIGNKPPADILKCQWDDALFGFNLGERSRLAYWVNRILYPEPSKATCKMSDSTQDVPQAEAGVLA